MKKKIICLLLTLCMVTSLLPMSSFAGGTQVSAAVFAAEAINAQDGDYWDDIENAALHLYTAKGAAYFSASGNTYAGYTILLENDVDVSGFIWSTVCDGGNGFSGTFDGRGHAIRSLTKTNGSVNICLFLRIDESGTVKNLNVYGNINIAGSTVCNVGVIAYDNYGVIDNCVSGVDITAKAASNDPDDIIWHTICIGGIALNNHGTIRNCKNTGNIFAINGSNNYAGGIVGSSYKNIYNCCNTGTVYAGGGFEKNYAGGIAGIVFSNSDIDNCLNTGIITVLGTGESDTQSCGAGYIQTDSRNLNIQNFYCQRGTAATLCNISGKDTVSVANCGIVDCGIVDCGIVGGGIFDGDCETITPADGQTLRYGSNLLAALNGWVDANTGADYRSWKFENGDYIMTSPVFWGLAVGEDKNAPSTWEGDGTLTQAVEYANTISNGTAYISLQADVVYASDDSLILKSAAVLDLNGNTIIANDYGVSIITVNACLTLKDSVGGGKISGQSVTVSPSPTYGKFVVNMDGGETDYASVQTNTNCIWNKAPKVDFDSSDNDGDVDYSVSKGNSIVAFKPSYLARLEIGKHVLEIVFISGSSGTALKIKENASRNSFANANGVD